MNTMLDMTHKYASLRCQCKNDHNGRANIGCIIYNRHYVLCLWH